MLSIKWIGANANNYQVGRAGKTVKYVVCHWIVGTLESADATFQNPTRIASATYGIGGNDIHQYVKETDTAYANGNLLSNRESCSIEHEGGWLLPDGVTRFKPTDQTHETSAQLVADICKRYNIPIDRQHILKHSEVSDKPTSCPGLLDIDRIVKRAKELSGIIVDDMTDDEKRAIEVLKSTKTEFEPKFGNLESTARGGVGALRDISGYEKVNKEQAGQLTITRDENVQLKKDLKICQDKPVSTPGPINPEDQGVIMKFLEWLKKVFRS